jgi:hypothetical protein
MKLTATLGFIKERRGIEAPYNLRQFSCLKTSLVPYLGTGKQRMVKAFNILKSEYYILKLELEETDEDDCDDHCCDICNWTFSIFQNPQDTETIKKKECISCYREHELVVSNDNGHHTVYGWNKKIIIEEVRGQVNIVKLSISSPWQSGECQLRETVWLEIKFDTCRGDHGHTFVPIVIN